MNDFSSIIDVYPITLINNENPAPWLDEQRAQHSFHADHINFDPRIINSESGTIYDCGMELVIDTPSQQLIDYYSSPVYSIFVLKDIAGRKYPLGFPTMPAMVMIQKGIQKSRLIVRYSSLKNPI